MKLARVRVSVWAVMLLVAAMAAFGTTSTLAQDATPVAADAAHPVHIHSGTCAALGEVVHPLTDVTTYNVTNSFSFGPAATPAAAEATPLPAVSVSQETPVLFSFTHIDASVADIIAGGYAINAHESAENISNYIACGDVPPCTGAHCALVTGVAVQLLPLNNSGYFGVARIDAATEGGVNVSVFLFHPTMPGSS